MRRSMKLLAILFVLTTASGCSLTPPNEEVCANGAIGNGHCFYPISNDERTVPSDLWAIELSKPGRISMTFEAFANFQAFIQKACELAKCTDSQKKQVDQVLAKMTQIIEASK